MSYQTIIDVSVAHVHLQEPDWVFVDCRFSLKDAAAGYGAYQKSHIPGAVYADLDHDLSSAVPVTDQGRHPLPAPEQMREVFGRLGITTGKQVVIYDDFNHAFASRLWWMLRYMGHETAAVIDGGWKAWQEAGYVTASGIETNGAEIFSGEPQTDRLVQVNGVRQQIRLIDSRSAERFRGEVEPLDPVAGHILGAVNYFYGQNLLENGRFAPPAQIAAALGPMLGGLDAAETTFYCGSGVSACVNLLALAHAGLGDAKLYVGSWSEWSRTQLN